MSEHKKSLRALYPFLEQNGTTPPADLARSIARKSAESATLQQAFFEQHSAALLAAAQDLATVFAAGGRLLCAGNGGSACDAAHLAVEFSHPVTTGRPALPAIDLGADTARVTAVANDAGFDQVFVRAVQALHQPGDALFVLSTSGSSPNLVNALTEARRLELRSFALIGGDGGDIQRGQLANHCLCVAADSIHRIQETHVICYHMLWDLVHTLLAEQS